MNPKALSDAWFDAWNSGNYKAIPVSDDFRHTSPYGTIEGRRTYLEIVESNKDKFLGNEIQIHDQVVEGNRCVVRYTIKNPAYEMEVTEWMYCRGNQIREIISYYNIEGEISESRELNDF